MMYQNKFETDEVRLHNKERVLVYAVQEQTMISGSFYVVKAVEYVRCVMKIRTSGCKFLKDYDHSQICPFSDLRAGRTWGVAKYIADAEPKVSNVAPTSSYHSAHSVCTSKYTQQQVLDDVDSEKYTIKRTTLFNLIVVLYLAVAFYWN